MSFSRNRGLDIQSVVTTTYYQNMNMFAGIYVYEGRCRYNELRLQLLYHYAHFVKRLMDFVMQLILELPIVLHCIGDIFPLIRTLP